MLVGAYPFEDCDDPRNFKKTINHILSVQYSILDYVRISMECKHLSRIFVVNPEKRINILEIKRHTCFLKNLPTKFLEGEEYSSEAKALDDLAQSTEEVLAIIREASKLVDGYKLYGQFVEGSSMDLDDELGCDVVIDEIDKDGTHFGGGSSF